MIKSQETQKKITPLMKQYWEVKNQHPDKIVFFRMGDFYELFYGDAQTAATYLGVTLTSRNKKDSESAPMCGFPHHSLPNYVNKLLSHGFKVAICDQVEDPKLAKGIVKREVTKILTPGMVFDFDLLESFQSHFIMAFDQKQICFIDASTFENFSIPWKEWSELERIVGSFEVMEYVHSPSSSCFSDDICNDKFNDQFKDKFKDKFFEILKKKNITVSILPESSHPISDSADAILISYIKYVNPSWTDEKVIRFLPRALNSKLKLSNQTIKQLELFDSFRGPILPSLFGVLNQCKTALGARKLRDWLRFPLTNLSDIETRQKQVQFFVSKIHVTKKIRELLSAVYDIQRKLGKVSQAQCSINDLQGLANSTTNCFDLFHVLLTAGFFEGKENDIAILAGLEERLKKLCEHVADIFVENPPISTKQGGLFKRGVYSDLDEWIDLSTDVQKLVQDLEQAEKQTTGINSLKVRYNQVFGFYIEVTHSQSDKVPAHYKRKQTLTNAERFYTDELMELEKKVLVAQSRRSELESEYFEKCKVTILHSISEFLQISDFASEIDLFSTLAWISVENNYVRPQMHLGTEFSLIHSRHPVVEKNLTSRFVPNSIGMQAGQAWVLTGPNMAGKSTLMRQAALIQIMAQMGSFVPAESARLPIMDAIYTRIGANDSLSEGLSTFMVEMKETAELLNEATSTSLILLDEIGRGTATYDGLSLAEAIIEYIVQKIKGYTLFATHYHEITAMAKQFPKLIRNGHMEIVHGDGADGADSINFSYVFKEGSVGRSYGIQVAELAGLPASLIQNAKLSLIQKEASPGALKKVREPDNQLSLFASTPRPDPISGAILAKLKALDLNTLSPIESLNWLHDVRNELNKQI